VKKLFGVLVLPAIGGFRVNRPDFVQTIFTTPGLSLTGTVLSKWYDEACGLDSSKPLNSKENRNILANENMDPDKAVMKNSQGVRAAVPYWKRTQKLGFPPGADRKKKKKKKSSDSVERGPALESSATEEELTYVREDAEAAESANFGAEGSDENEGERDRTDVFAEAAGGPCGDAMEARGVAT
jgi:hypothetical protein